MLEKNRYDKQTIREQEDELKMLREMVEEFKLALEEMRRASQASQGAQERVKQLEAELRRLRGVVRLLETQTGSFTSEWVTTLDASGELDVAGNMHTDANDWYQV